MLWKKSGELVVHHLDGYAWCKEKRTNVYNGITLCENCHLNFHSQYGYGNNTREQFEKWFGDISEILLNYDGLLATTRKIYDATTNEIFESSSDFSNKYNISVSNVCRCCNHNYELTAKGHVIFWYNEYINLSSEEINAEINKCKDRKHKKIICLETGEIFRKIIDATKKYNCSSINSHLKGRAKSAGKLKDGTKLHWMYYEDYINATPNEIYAKMNPEYIAPSDYHICRAVIYLTTGVIFNSVKEASEKYTDLDSCLSGITKTAGKLPDGTKLHWMYYDEHLNSTKEDVDKIINNSDNYKATPVICLTTGEVFDSLTLAPKKIKEVLVNA